MGLSSGMRLGPYEILSPLGAGGMGEVYRARDPRLDRDVAIKVLPEELFEDKERQVRFEREAKALAAVSHPNIAVIHSFEEVSGRYLLVQELLEGESLRGIIRERPPSPRKAIDFGAQIANGLAAAHAKGIVHRDLKPENVFVTREGQVKILDFGLARRVAVPEGVDTESPTVARDTEPGVVMGTVGYLSPEQVRGQPADARSDIFAFGCVLYEMLAGRRAFSGETPADTMAAILREDPAPLAGSGREIVPALRTIVQRCLEKRPADRFSSAHDLAIALEAFSGGEETAPSVPAPSGPSRIVGRRVATLGLVAIAVLVAGAGVLLWRSKSAKPPPPGPKRVVVAAFEDKTGDPAAARIAVLVTERITTGLSRVGGITVAADPATLPETKSGSPSATGEGALRSLAVRTGAGLVVAGAVYASGGEVELQARLVAPGEGRVIYAVEPARGPLSGLDAAVELLRQRVLGAVATQVEGWHIDPSVMRPPSFEAYQELVRAREIYNSDIPASIRHAERMVALDPKCSFGYVALAMFLMNKGAFAEAEKPLVEAERLRAEMTPFERLMFAYMTAQLAGRLPESLDAIRRMNEMAPKLDWVRHCRAGQELALKMPQAAIRTLEGPIYELVGGVSSGEPLVLRISARHLLREHEVELAAAREARVHSPSDLRFAFAEAAALAALGRISEIDRVIDSALPVSASIASAGEVMRETALELRAHGRSEAASKMLVRALEWYRGRPAAEAANEGNRSELGTVLLRTGKVDKAAAVFADLAREHSDNVSYKGYLGVIAAARGDRAEADRISEELGRIDRPYLFGQHHYCRAGIAARLGEKEKAVELLRRAFSEGFPFNVAIHRDPDLEPLRGYPPFDELMKPKG